jgi:hypothetical protein
VSRGAPQGNDSVKSPYSALRFILEALRRTRKVRLTSNASRALPLGLLTKPLFPQRRESRKGVKMEISLYFGDHADEKDYCSFILRCFMCV